MEWEVAEASVRQAVRRREPGRARQPRVPRRRAAGQPQPDPPRDRARRARCAREEALPIGFSITTNGTLLNADDGEFFERYGFAVTISLDGVGATS